MAKWEVVLQDSRRGTVLVEAETKKEAIEAVFRDDFDWLVDIDWKDETMEPEAYLRTERVEARP